MEINVKQILTISITVIIVTTLIVIGVNIYNTQRNNKLGKELSTDLLHQASIVQEWFFSPVARGGGGNGRDNFSGSALAAKAINIVRYFNTPPRSDYVTDIKGDTMQATYRNALGDFTLRVTGSTGSENIEITGISKAKKSFIMSATFRLSQTKDEVKITVRSK